MLLPDIGGVGEFAVVNITVCFVVGIVVLLIAGLCISSVVVSNVACIVFTVVVGSGWVLLLGPQGQHAVVKLMQSMENVRIKSKAFMVEASEEVRC